MKTKQVLIIAFLILIIGGSIGFYLLNMGPVNYEKAEPDFFVTVEELILEYQKDEGNANQIYLNKIIQIEGTVVSNSTANQGKRYISFVDPMDGLTCTFDSIQAIKVLHIKPGDQLVVKGRCDGKLTDIRLSKCVLIKPD